MLLHRGSTHSVRQLVLFVRAFLLKGGDAVSIICQGSVLSNASAKAMASHSSTGIGGIVISGLIRLCSVPESMKPSQQHKGGGQANSRPLNSSPTCRPSGKSSGCPPGQNAWRSCSHKACCSSTLSQPQTPQSHPQLHSESRIKDYVEVHDNGSSNLGGARDTAKPEKVSLIFSCNQGYWADH